MLNELILFPSASQSHSQPPTCEHPGGLYPAIQDYKRHIEVIVRCMKKIIMDMHANLDSPSPQLQLTFSLLDLSTMKHVSEAKK